MSTVNGLPAHILLVHAVVVLLPLSAALLVVTALWPAARRLAGPNAALASLVVLLVPLTTSAGEWLERRVPGSALIHRHAELGDTAIFYAIPIAVLALLVWWRERENGTPRRRTFLRPASRAVTGVLAALAILVGAAGIYGTYRIGDSGAKAAWNTVSVAGTGVAR